MHETGAWTVRISHLWTQACGLSDSSFRCHLCLMRHRGVITFLGVNGDFRHCFRRTHFHNNFPEGSIELIVQWFVSDGVLVSELAGDPPAYFLDVACILGKER